MGQKVWFVTGASRGFGAEIAKAVLSAGDKLVATARRTEALRFLGENGNLLALTLDVTNEVQVKDAVDSALSNFSCIDISGEQRGFRAARRDRGK